MAYSEEDLCAAVGRAVEFLIDGCSKPRGAFVDVEVMLRITGDNTVDVDSVHDRLRACSSVIEFSEDGTCARPMPSMSADEVRGTLAWTLPGEASPFPPPAYTEAPNPLEDEEKPDPPAGNVDLELLREYVVIVDRRKEISAEDRRLKSDKNDAEQVIGGMYAEAGVSSVNVDDSNVHAHEFGFAVFPAGEEVAVDALRKTDWDAVRAAAESEDWQAVVAAIAGDGTGAMLAFGFNKNTLHAYVREQIKQHDRLPSEFEGLIDYAAKWRVGVKS